MENKLSNCKLCGGEADYYYRYGTCQCKNKECAMYYVSLKSDDWQKLNAPDPRITALVKENEALRNVCGDAADHFNLDWVCRNCDCEFDSKSGICPECGSDNVEENDCDDPMVKKLKEACDNGIEGGSDV